MKRSLTCATLLAWILTATLAFARGPQDADVPLRAELLHRRPIDTRAVALDDEVALAEARVRAELRHRRADQPAEPQSHARRRRGR